MLTVKTQLETVYETVYTAHISVLLVKCCLNFII